jgi:Methylmalonic aciduria and homocystinuria type D protein
VDGEIRKLPARAHIVRAYTRVALCILFNHPVALLLNHTPPSILPIATVTLLQFFTWAEQLRACLALAGHWMDYMDPSSGYPMHEPRGGSIYSTMSGIQVLLPYRVSNCGGCWLVSHPRYHTSVYPATAFTTAPLSLLTQLGV